MAFDLEQIVDLALFARLVDARSFSEAARRTGIAKSAVSRRIALLEKRLGVQLVRRSTRSLKVTTDGARFYEHCARVLAAARAAEDALFGASTLVRGLVRIGAPVTFSQMHLASVVAAFQLHHPDVEVQLQTNDRFDDAITAELDVIVRVTRLRDGDFVAKRLATDRLIVVGAPSYLARRGRPESAEDLVHHDCLHYTLVDRDAEWRFRGRDRTSLLVGRGSFSTNDGTVLRKTMLEGLGLAVLPLFMVAADVAAGRAVLLLEGERAAEIGIYAVVSTVRGLPQRVRALIEHMQRHFARSDWREIATVAGESPAGRRSLQPSKPRAIRPRSP